jgi:hypothetical protein
MNRRSFLAALGTAPLAALAPWRAGVIDLSRAVELENRLRAAAGLRAMAEAFDRLPPVAVFEVTVPGSGPIAGWCWDDEAEAGLEVVRVEEGGS